MDKNYIDSTTLIFKNIPKEIDDLTNLLNSLNIPAKDIKPFGRKRALITYELKSETEKALETLSKLEFSGKSINVSWFCKDKPKENKVLANAIKKVNRSVQTNKVELIDASCLQTVQQVNKYVKKLYAIEGDLGFDQPPPPYLKYNYPPINKDIMDNICISLLSNKRFYTQVLHLMNRMNLEPPFGERKYKFKPPGVPKDAGTQTDEILVKLPVQQQQTEGEDESELETSGEEETHKNRPVATTLIKRKLPPNEEQYKKKARKMLQNVQKLNKESTKKPKTNKLSIKEIFDKPETPISTKIEFHVKQMHPTGESKKSAVNVKPLLILPEDLKQQKLSQQDLEQLPIYKNYQKGEASNKLYIKNLHKDVSSEDLTVLYKRFLPTESNIKLDVNVMQHGRMKGQAFVTFQGEQMDIIQKIIAQALDETNGFTLRDKPMIVCYGKRS